jgi:hypothetical protein
MTTTDQFLFARQAYPEIPTELHQNKAIPLSDEKGLSKKSFVTSNTPLSTGSLVLGWGENGLPVTFDLYDPAPGPLLVAGDGGSGKTKLLKTLAQASNLQIAGDIQFGVITPFPEEWTEQEASPNSMGIWPAYHPAAMEFVSRLISWADNLQGTHQLVLLLVDGLDLLTAFGFKIQKEFQWLLKNGPERHVWPVVTINPGRLAHLDTWLDYFPTRILGQIKRSQTCHLLIDDPKINLAGFEAGKQFGFSRPDGWLKFRLPVIE